MSSVAFSYTCSCGHHFEAAETPEMSYGLFVARTRGSDEAVFVNALEDPVFSRSSDLAKAHPRLARASDAEKGRVSKRVFSVTCDPAPGGEPFELDIMPKCPSCGSREMASWDQVFPPKAWPLPGVTHDRWNALTPAQQAALVDEAVQRVLAGGAN